MTSPIDDIRLSRGLLTIAETLALSHFGNVILDPFSTLISRATVIGRDNVIEPNVQLLCFGDAHKRKARLHIGNGNTFCSGTRIETATGDILVGSGNEIGDGGFSARTTAPGARITIGNEGRYTLNCAVSGHSTLGDGSQVLGPITVDNCHLGAGGSHREDDPDLRGAVLKGTGRARGLTLARGQVIQAFGLFDMADVKMQSFYHPRGQ